MSLADDCRINNVSCTLLRVNITSYSTRAHWLWFYSIGTAYCRLGITLKTLSSLSVLFLLGLWREPLVGLRSQDGKSQRAVVMGRWRKIGKLRADPGRREGQRGGRPTTHSAPLPAKSLSSLQSARSSAASKCKNSYVFVYSTTVSSHYYSWSLFSWNMLGTIFRRSNKMQDNLKLVSTFTYIIFLALASSRGDHCASRTSRENGIARMLYFGRFNLPGVAQVWSFRATLSSLHLERYIGVVCSVFWVTSHPLHSAISDVAMPSLSYPK